MYIIWCGKRSTLVYITCKSAFEFIYIYKYIRREKLKKGVNDQYFVVGERFNSCIIDPRCE